MKRCLSILILLIPFCLFAEDRHSHFDLNVQLRHRRFTDPTVSPLNYYGLVGGLALDYRYENSSWGCDIGVECNGGQVWNGYEYYETDLSFGGRIFSGFWRRIPLGDGGASISLGGRVEYELFAAFLNHLSMYNWLGELSLSPLLRFEYSPDRLDCFFGEISIPIFSLLNRPAWTVYDNEIDELVSDGMLNLLLRGDSVTIDRYLKIRTKFGYQWQCESGFGISTGAGLVYKHTAIPRKASFIDLFLNIGINYAF